MVLLGLGSLAASMLLYPMAWNEWTLAIPASVAGFAHAFLFPAVIGGGSVSFPSRYRGLGATLMFAMFDLGNLVGQPAVGMTLEAARWAGLPAYPTMFLAMAATLLSVAAVYAAIAPRGRFVDEPAVVGEVTPRHGETHRESAQPQVAETSGPAI